MTADDNETDVIVDRISGRFVLLQAAAVMFSAARARMLARLQLP